MSLRLKFHIESADHCGYCSGNEGEYSSEYKTILLPIPDSLKHLKETWASGEAIPLHEFKTYDFRETYDFFGIHPDPERHPVDLFHEFDDSYYGLIRYRMKAGQSAYCDRSNLPEAFSDEIGRVRVCNTDYIQLVEANIVSQ